MSTSMNPLKFGYRVLYYIIMFGIFFQFFAYPVYAMVEHFPYGAKTKYYIHYECPDDYLNSEAFEGTDPQEASVTNPAVKSKNGTKSYRLAAPSVPTSSEEAAIEIFSQDKSGTIGYDNNSNSDDPSDNIFSFNIEKTILTGKEIRLSYEVYGIENASGISRSINENNATGGYLVKKNSQWNHLEETISIDQLKNGVNHLLFTAFENKNSGYKVKNVTVKAVPSNNQKFIALADGTSAYTKNNKAYFKGSVLLRDSELYINNEKVKVKNNEFETLISHDSGTTQLDVQLKRQGVLVYTETVQLTEAAEAAVHTFKKAEGYSLIKALDTDSYGFLMDEVGFNIKKESYAKADQISVQKLRAIDLAPLGTNIINVTQNKTGYRFLPEGAKFKGNAQITVKFDKTLLPSGYNANDVKILYFDMDQRRWLSVPTDTIMTDQNKVVGLTDHFTDYIAGIIQSPESPETSSFTPTSISDIQVANPTANIMQVQPPTANQKGDGTLDFPITIPPGRNGLQPNLSVSYNNNGSSSIVGYGWDIAIPFISVDTKFGIPQYIGNQETESYLFNGEELVMQNGNALYIPHRQSTTVSRNTAGVRVFFPKVEGSFSKIERHGTTPSTYYWIVWDKSGAKYFYGQGANSRLSSASGNRAKWMLEKVQDKNGNYIQYNYIIKNYTTGNLVDGKELLISQIIYTRSETTGGLLDKTVNFSYDSDLRADANFNFRYGFKEVNAAKLLKISTDGRGDHMVSYDFAYKQGRFGKTLLDFIQTNNSAINTSSGTESYKHTFDYYDDVADGLFHPSKNMNLYDDFSSEKHSALSSTVESYRSNEINVGGGISPIANPPAWWPFSYGGTINFAFPSSTSIKSAPTMLLIDIDGDGLDDKVMKIGQDIKYRKNLGGAFFSQELYKVHNINDLGLFENYTQNGTEKSLSIIAGNLNWSKSETNARVRNYFSDVNADGLVDYVKDRIVYFNRIDPNSGLPTFTDDSNITPNRIFKEGDVDPGISDPLPDLTLGNDLMEVVKIWIAPKSGTININGTISKQLVSSNHGVRYAVQKSGSRIRFAHESIYFDPNIAPVPWNPSTPISGTLADSNPSSYIIEPTLLITNSINTNKTGISVNKGDYIYFRVNSSQLPVGLVNVTWDPEITYTTENFDSPNQYKQYSSKYSDAYIYGSIDRIPLMVTEPGNYRLQWNSFTVNNSSAYPELTDEVEIVVHGYKLVTNSNNTVSRLPLTGNSTEVIRRKIKVNTNNSIAALNQLFNFSDVNGDDPETYKYFEIEVLTTSQIDWKKFDNKFIPKFLKVEDNSTRYVIPQYRVYNSQLTNYYKSTFTSSATVTINHNFNLLACSSNVCSDKVVYMLVKNQFGKIVTTLNGLPAKFKYVVNGNGAIIVKQQYNGTSFSSLTGNNSQITANNVSLYFEYYADDAEIASRLKNYQDNTNLLTSNLGNTQHQGIVNGLYRANIFYINSLSGFGTVFRNWGQFAYKGVQPNENFKLINKGHLSKLAIAGISSTTTPSQEEIDMFDDLMNQDIDDLDYDFDTDTFTSGGANVGLNQNQMDAILHFTMLQPDRLNQAWSSHRRLYVKSAEMSPYLRYDDEEAVQMLPIPAPTSVGTYGAVSVIKESFSKSRSEGKSISFFGFSFGDSESESKSTPLNDFMDINGDGYPDVVGNQVQLTSYRGGLSSNILNKNLLASTNSSGKGKAAGGSTAHITSIMDNNGRVSGFRVGNNASFKGNSIGGNSSKFETVSKAESILVDINGDGLVDLIRNGSIELNRGNGFIASSWAGYGGIQEQLTTSKSMSANFGVGFTDFIEPITVGAGSSGRASSNLDLSFGFSGSRSVTQSKKDFVDVNGDGLPDYIVDGTVYFNTGTNHINSGLSLPRLAESSSLAHGEMINASILIPVTIPFLGIIAKGGGGGGKNWTKNYNEENVSYRDFDGDGYLDIVESSSETNLKVQLSKIARTNMLKMVHNPTGSKIELDYAAHNAISGTSFGSTYKMPFKKWVLSGVKVHDGFEGDGEDIQQFAFEYQNGLKDRRERKFLGFGEVKTHQLRSNGSVFRTSVQEYLLNDMPNSEIYLPGNYSDSRKYQYIGSLLKSETVFDATQRLLSKNSYTYSIHSLPGVNGTAPYSTSGQSTITYADVSRILPLVKENETVVRNYTDLNGTNYIDDVNRSIFRTYDQYGNVVSYRDDIDNIDVTVGYYYTNNASKYIVSIPSQHRVMLGGTLLRRSTTQIDANGNITQISRYNTNGISVTDYQYDNLGNLRKVTLPKPNGYSAESERMFYTYQYDNTYRQFVRFVTDAYGLTSESNYTNYGLLLSQTDANGVVFTYKYDPSRRLKEFKGPYHNNWTIKNEYAQDQTSSLYYAVTQHNLIDEVTGNNNTVLHTSSFADGLGRIIQTKKQLDTVEDCGGSGYSFAVSGPQKYDEFGRVVESYLGQQQLDCGGNFMLALKKYEHLQHDVLEKTDNWYDNQDRPLQTHVYGLNATTRYEYGVASDGFGTPRSFEKVVLPEGNTSFSFKDHKGRVTSTKQVSQNTSEELVTKYQYNQLGEVTDVIDAENKVTSYQYDMFGQKISVKHPDNGNSVFSYDLAGRLKSTANQNLINNSQTILYNYYFNRLISITYPSHTVNYKYGTVGNNPGGALGRIINITDLTGTRKFKYGSLGEVTEETRNLNSQTGTLIFNTKYRYDSWGRILEMTYPDGEELQYGYNTVGQLKSIVNTDNEVYLKDVAYNFFDQPTRISYGNGVETINEYDITQRVRAMKIDRPDQSTLMRNVYSYDRNQNIIKIQNNNSQHNLLRMGGVFNKEYIYDQFNRLEKANGMWKGYQETHQYSLSMGYNKTHGIKNKMQKHTMQTPGFNGETVNTYAANYKYDNSVNQHAVSSIDYNDLGGNHIGTAHFKYDDNGNMLGYNSDVQQAAMSRQMVWDEQNRLQAVIDNDDRISHYVYDHAGERTFKSEGNITNVNIAGQNIYSVLNFNDYVIYPSGNIVVTPGKNEYSKHYYINSKRFVSRLGVLNNTFTGTANNLVSAPESADKEGTANSALSLPVAVNNVTYSINIGNDPQNCEAQLNAILTFYQANNNPPSHSIQHCINAITAIINNPSITKCQALVQVNNYVCTPQSLNTPDIILNPIYTQEQMEQFDCLTQLNILTAEYAANAIGLLDHYPETVSEIYDCAKNCRKYAYEGTNCVIQFEQTGEWSEDCKKILRECGCMPPNDCFREALIYINNHLVLEPVSNACEVYATVLEKFDCGLKGEPVKEPEPPRDNDDEWVDHGGSNNLPGDGPYNEDYRKPIWWYHTDHLGSSTYLTDNFGRPSHYYETLPFGEMMVEHNQSANVPSGVGYDNKFKFNGKELDDATQMYYYGARYYDPRISIFVSVDPLAEQTMTPYQYVTNNPIMFTDPTGMVQDDVYRRDGDKFIWVRKNNENEGTKDHVGVFSQNANGEYVQDTNKDGSLKYEAQDISEGILSRYKSFTSMPRYFDVGGDSGLQENDILDFAVKLQSMVKKEISGYALSDKSKGGEIKGMMIEPYKFTRDGVYYENDATTSNSTRHMAMKVISGATRALLGKNIYPFYHFHTHPDASAPSDRDMKAAGENSSLDRFIINNRFQKLQYGEYGFFKNKR